MIVNKLFSIAVLTIGYFCFCTGRQLPAQDIFQGLGDLTGGLFDSRARAVSPDGSVIAGLGNGTDGYRGFRWTSSEGMTQLNGVFNGETFASGVSDTGRIVGVSPGLFDDFATYWNPDGSVGGSLGDFDGGTTYSQANGVSANGNVIVGYGNDASGERAFRWTSATGLEDLGISASRSNAISADGTTIVGVGAFGGDNQAFRWRDGGIDALGYLPGGSGSSTAVASAADGSVVVGTSDNAGGVGEAFRWTPGQGMVGLGQLAGSVSSSAKGISGDGSLVIGLSGGRGFIWDPQQGMRDFMDVVRTDFGLDMTGWTRLIPNAISEDGLTIVGQGDSPNALDEYVYEAFRIKVDPRWIAGSSGQWNDRSNWALGINPNELHDLIITPTTGLTVTKESGSSTIRSLQLSAATGTATLNLQNSSINVLNQTSIGNGGRLTGNQGGTFNAVGGISNLGTIDLGTGLQVLSGTINNLGLVRGDGEIDSRLENTAVGEIRVGPGQHMWLTGSTSPNQGLINVVGGTFEVSRSYVNEGASSLIYARNATLRFNGGLTNGGSEESGAIGISFGTTDIYGDVNNRIGSVINISGGANVTFVDDLVQNGTMEVVRIGDTVSKAVIFGGFTGSQGFVGGGDVFALGDLRPGNSPASVLMDGNLYFGSQTDSYFELGGLMFGEFDQIRVTGELGLAGDLFVNLIDGFQLSGNDEFLIADVLGDVTGQFTNLEEGDLVGVFGGRSLYITYAAGTGNDVALFSPVPEPTGLVFVSAALFGMCVLPRRKRLAISR